MRLERLARAATEGAREDCSPVEHLASFVVPSSDRARTTTLPPTKSALSQLCNFGIELPFGIVGVILSRPMRVLSTEDEPHIAHEVARALVRDGHVVSIAGSIGEAREASRHGADRLVFDLGLPDGSGLALCRELRSQHSRLPILILTAQSEETPR